MWYFALSQNCFKCNYTNILASNPEPFYFVLQCVLKKLVFIRKSTLIIQWTNTVLWTNGVTSLMKVLPKDWIPSKLHEIIVVLFLTRGIRFQVKIVRNHCANTKVIQCGICSSILPSCMRGAGNEVYIWLLFASWKGSKNKEAFVHVQMLAGIPFPLLSKTFLFSQRYACVCSTVWRVNNSVWRWFTFYMTK